jgi:tetraacyldisaccharide 4'-kinase
MARRRVERAWDAGAGGALLAVPELVFRGISKLYHAAYDRGVLPSAWVGVPVISIGNLTVGGSGKTPFTRWVVTELLRAGATPAILHGGYADDEPALHRAWFPQLCVVAGRDRAAGAARAEAAGASVVVLDDGFQHRRLGRQVDIVLVAAEDWERRPRLLPRGRWRETPAALRRATVVVITRKTADPAMVAAASEGVAAFSRGRPVACVLLEPAGWRDARGAPAPAPPAGVVAVAGVARPESFFAQAAAAGAVAGAELVFPDHHAYGLADLERIRGAAGDRGIATTAKDGVKLGALLPDTPMWILEQRVVFEKGRAEVERILEGVGQ